MNVFMANETFMMKFWYTYCTFYIAFVRKKKLISVYYGDIKYS